MYVCMYVCMYIYIYISTYIYILIWNNPNTSKQTILTYRTGGVLLSEALLAPHCTGLHGGERLGGQQAVDAVDDGDVYLRVEHAQLHAHVRSRQGQVSLRTGLKTEREKCFT